MITEQIVRLLRRLIICHYVGDKYGVVAITDYLRSQGIEEGRDFVYVRHPTPLLTRPMQPNERWLAEQFGAVHLPQHLDTLFLNPGWANPNTLYIRLLKPIPELGERGELRWTPYPKTWQDVASRWNWYYNAHGITPGKLRHLWWKVREWVTGR